MVKKFADYLPSIMNQEKNTPLALKLTRSRTSFITFRPLHFNTALLVTAFTAEHRQCIKAVNEFDTPCYENELVSTSLEPAILSPLMPKLHYVPPASF